MKITYVGYSDRMADLLLKDVRFQVASVVTGKGKLSMAMRNRMKGNGIPLYEATDKKTLLNLKQEFIHDAVIMYEFGLILPREITEGADIYNIHPGDLDTNRGAHPIRWTILLGEPETKMTMYKVAGIDEGYIVGERICKVGEDDDYLSLKKKMEEYLPWLLDRFIDVTAGHLPTGRMSRNGGYRKKVEEKDYLIDMKRDSFLEIKRKINAMKDFGGAVMISEDKKYRVSGAELADGEIRLIREPFVWR